MLVFSRMAAATLRWVAGFWLASSLMVQAGEADPADVVSIGGAVTEIVYALGQEHRLLARDTTSTYPPQVEELPDVGYVRSLSPEGVLSVAPKIILSDAGAGPAEAVEVLKSASVDFVEVPQLYTVQGLAQKIRIVGHALGADDQAEVLAQEMLAELQVTLDDVARRQGPPKRVLFVLSTTGGRIMAGGEGTSAEAIIHLAGGVNAVSSFKGYKPISPEALAIARPDVVLMMKRRDGHINPSEELFAMPALALTPAARTKSVVRLDGLLLLGFGPRLPQAVSDLHHALYGASAGGH